MQIKFWYINRYFKSIVNDLVVICEEIIDMSITVSKNPNGIKTKIKMSFYILRTIFVFNDIVINSCYQFLFLLQSKQKDILPNE